MAKKWESKVRLDGHCVVHKDSGPPYPTIPYHYHTRLLDETKPEWRWYLANGWSLSRFCQLENRASTHGAIIGNPDQDWVHLDD